MAQEPFGDIPLFREIQRILSSGEGPVNLEIARQVANAIATQGLNDTTVDPTTTLVLERAAQEAERFVAGYSRRQFDEPLRSKGVGRGWWVQSTLESWRWLLDRLAEHFSRELARLQPGEQGAGEQGTGEQGADMMQGAMAQMAPLLMGLQAGTLVGHLARGALARYDLPIPRDDDGRVFFVVPNLDRVATEYDLEQEALLRWMALHETSRHVVVASAPWVPRYLRSLLTEVVDSTEIDTSDLERRLIELQTKGMRAFEEPGAESQLPVVSSERHRKALERLRAFVAAFEGYAAHVEEAVAPKVTDDSDRVREGVRRFRAANNEGEALLGSVLGITLDREVAGAGSTFCAAVVKLKGLGALNEVWAAADNLPTMAEIKDPFAWMERVLGD